MAPSNLQGLNVVRMESPTTREYTSDSQDLLNFPTYPDFNAQLDLWTNLTFESEEPSFLQRKGDRQNPESGKSSPGDDSTEDDDEGLGKDDLLYQGKAHENVVTGIPLPNQGASAPSSQPGRAASPISAAALAHALSHTNRPASTTSLDIASLLTSIGIDPFGANTQQLQQQNTTAPNIPSLAQLLALPGTLGIHNNLAAPTLPIAPALSAQARQTASDAVSAPRQKSVSTSKRARTARSPTEDTDSSSLDAANTTTPVTHAEDKRRRNTAASARFRLKKKEREAALEKRAKELETKVNELEKECEGLKRENGWLKGLVVGVTGGVASQQLPQDLDVRVGVKRSREEDG